PLPAGELTFAGLELCEERKRLLRRLALPLSLTLEPLRLNAQATLPRGQCGLALGGGVRQLFAGAHGLGLALGQRVLTFMEPRLHSVQRLLARLDTGALPGNLGVLLARCALAGGNGLVALARRMLPGRQARLGFLAPRVER